MALSPILGITQVAPNQNNKETTINDGVAILERSLNDQLTVDLTAGSVVLLTTDFQRHQVFVGQGHGVARNLTIPVLKRFFAVRNTGTGIITVRTAVPLSTVAVPVGSYVIIYADGANNCTKIADSASSGLTPLFTSLTDTPSTYVGQALKNVRVNAGETALEFVTFALDLEDLDDVPAPTASYFLRRNAANTAYEFVSSAGSLAADFIALTDTPATYVGQANKIVAVNPTADGLVFSNPNNLLTFLNLSDAPDTFVGQGNKLVAVNAGGTALEFVTSPVLGTFITEDVSDANEGFESGIVPWVATVGSLAEVYHVTSASGVTPYEGAEFIQFNAPITAAISIRRTYDLTVDATATELDNNARVTFAWAYNFAGITTQTGAVTIECLTAADALLSSTPITGLTGVAFTWYISQATVNLPLGTRKIRVTLASTNSVAGLDFMWDRVNLDLTTLLPISFLQLPDTPDTFVGQANKFLRVKSDETQVEFVAPTFLGLDDAPNAYTGQAGRFVRVNVAENATEFATGAVPVPIQEEGVAVTAVPLAINFVGAGATVTDVSGVATVTIPGGTASPSVIVQEEGISLTVAVTKINFVGAGVVASEPSPDEILVTIAGDTTDLSTLNTLTQLRVISRVTTLPGAPADGVKYIVPAGAGLNPNQIAVRVSGAWVYYVASEGYIAYIEDEDTYYRFDGTTWHLAFGPRLVTEATTARTVENSDFDGRTIIDCTSASPTTLTINTGLLALGPAFYRRSGTGLLTFAGTATLRSLGGILTSRGQYSMVGVVPLGGNVYQLEGVST